MTANQPTSLEPVASRYRRLYARVESLSASPYALVAMLLVSVVDGSVFPIPPFALLVPMVLARPRNWWKLALYGTAASIAGGIIGYGIGALIGEGAAQLLHIDLNVRIHRFGIDSTAGELLGREFWVLALLSSVLPTPFKVVAIGSGILKVPLSRFLLASLIGRFFRFFAVAGAMSYFGPRARKWVRA